MAQDDCTFYYFMPGGKWKHAGRGRFPRPLKEGEYYIVDRAAILRENGSMPGITGDAEDLHILVIPDDSCEVTTAYPRLLFAEST